MKAESKNPTALYIGNPYDGRLLLLRIMGYVGFEVTRVVFPEKSEELNECLYKAPDLSLVVFDLNLFSKDDFSMAVEQYTQIKAHSKTHGIPFILFMRDNQFDEELANKIIADKLIKYPIDPDEVVKMFREYLPSADVHI